MFSYQLKVKAKALVAEAQIIRNEESKLWRRHDDLRATVTSRNGDAFASKVTDKELQRLCKLSLAATDLRRHRIGDVRDEARSTNVARGFLRGLDYARVENRILEGNWPDWDRVSAMVKKYGQGDSRVSLQRFEEWKQKGVKEVVQANAQTRAEERRLRREQQRMKPRSDDPRKGIVG